MIDRLPRLRGRRRRRISRSPPGGALFAQAVRRSAGTSVVIDDLHHNGGGQDTSEAFEIVSGDRCRDESGGPAVNRSVPKWRYRSTGGVGTAATHRASTK